MTTTEYLGEKKFVSRLKRLKKGLSEAKFAKICDLPRTTISGYLSGNSPPKLPALYKIALAHNVTVGWLVDDETVIYKDKSPDQEIHGDNNIQAGGEVSVNESSITYDSVKKLPKKRMEGFLDPDEEELIFMLRDFGGKRMLRKFRSELLELRRHIDGE